MLIRQTVAGLSLIATFAAAAAADIPGGAAPSRASAARGTSAPAAGAGAATAAAGAPALPPPPPATTTSGGVRLPAAPASTSPSAPHVISPRLLAPAHAPATLDFGSVWDAESANRTLTFKATAAGVITAAPLAAPYSIKAIRIMGVGASGGSASTLGGAAMAGMSMARNVRVSQTAPPWQVTASPNEEIQIDVTFEPKFDLFTMAAGAKPSTLVVKGPGNGGNWTMNVPIAGMFNGKRIGVVFLITQAEIPVVNGLDKEVTIPVRLIGTSTGATGLIHSKTLPPGVSFPAKSVAVGANQTIDVPMTLWNTGIASDGVEKKLEIAFDYGNATATAATTIIGLPASLTRQTGERHDCGVQKAHLLLSFNVTPDHSVALMNHQFTIFNTDVVTGRNVYVEWLINGGRFSAEAETSRGFDKMAVHRSSQPFNLALRDYVIAVRDPLMIGCAPRNLDGSPPPTDLKWEQAH
jgi:hypothetical protein